MKRDFSTTLEGIEHDHTRLDVLFEDLEATARQGLQEQGDPTMLEDAQLIWQHLHEEILSHLAREERFLFTMLSEEYPELIPELQALVSQHKLLRRQIQGIGAALHAEPGVLELAQASFDRLWSELAGLWTEHSAREWALLTRIREDSGDPLQDGQV